MLKSKLFLRYFLIAASFSFAFFMLMILAAQSIKKDSLTDLPGQGQMRMLTESLSTLLPEERIDFLEENSFSQHGKRPFGIYLCDDKGKIIFPQNRNLEIIDIKKKTGTSMFSFLFTKEKIKQIVALPGEPKQFLVFSIELDSAHPQIVNRKNKFLNVVGFLSVAMVLGIFIGLLLIFALFRNRAKYLDQVINELHNGNLKARLPIGKMDEIGQMMSRFNRMADEIENLVNSLQKAEATRKELLRELAHDLRTPIASLKNLLEMSYEKKHLLSEDQKDELLKTSLNEIEYFSSLVDDLLFLGQIQNPKYKVDAQLISFTDIAQEEINQIKPRYPNVAIHFSSYSDEITFHADEKLMRRLLRNLLENSFSFAKENIFLDISKEDNFLKISITDDGCGFSSEALARFGQKQAKRLIAEDHNRISIGLGSVIMKSIVESYGGKITPENIMQPDGKIAGAKVNATLSIF